MKRQPRILAGTAIGLFMASAPLGAMPLPSGMASTNSQALPLVRVQAECQEGESAEACAARQGGGQQAPEPRQQPQAEQPAPEPQAEQPQRKKRQPVEEAAPQEAAPEPQAEQPQRKKRQPVEEAAPQEAAPEPQAEQPQRKKRQPVEEAAPQEAAPEPQAEQPKHKKRQPVEEAAPQEAAPEPQAEQPQAEQPKHKKRQPAAEAPVEQPAQTPEVAPQPEPQAEQPAPKHNKKEKAPAEETKPVETPEVAPQPEPQPQAEKPAEKPAEITPEQVPTPTPSGETPVEGKKPGKHKPAEQPATEQPATGEKPAEGAQPAEKPAEGEKPAGEQSSGQPAEKPATAEQPATGEKPATAEQPATGEKPATAEQPATGEQPAKQVEERPTMQREQPANPNDAPILDSQKEEVAPVEAGQKPARGKPGKSGEQGQTGEQPAQQPQPVDLGPPPTDDKTAQEAAQPVEIKPVIAEQGTRLDKAPDFDIRRRPRPEGTEVLREIGDRIIIQINNQVIVESNDRPRMTRDAQEVYYDELPGGRTREVIVRDNGNQIITVRNRYGDIVRRSRITPDGREYVLNYVDDQYYQDMDEWRDPGLDLPPLQLRIPRQQYILDAQYVDDPEAYYDFLERPPVERVKRLYSVDEVKRSARVRDIARRVDLDTLNFEFGSASISEDEVAKLEGVANAIEKLLKKNPAETFLIEGHTDAVGSDVANLALSDRRAESVADALTNVFGIPPENLTTQGYGERYLKVKTEARERENRRVAIRRITPLVAPVASANAN
ncbi:OmpA family protein [Hoeflea sp. 108]|uniref:OmpA family protein n=1 Tax=Hoeflea sp. 108 TaxID=1116369 RepID=UPI00037C2864|nr:OmpA family protein [Hoeflea sp. 108]